MSVCVGGGSGCYLDLLNLWPEWTSGVRGSPLTVAGIADESHAISTEG